MPRVKKAAGTAVDPRNGQRALGVLAGGQVERFPPPRRVCKAAKDAWEGFWEDRPAALLTPAAKVVLLRWVDALDRYLRATAEADAEPLVRGSQGQQVINPLYKVAAAALTTVESCEKQLGIGGLNAASLGLAAISERRSLQEMNARYGGDHGDDGNEEPDPRLRIVGELAGE
jgi:hypothetical protein